MKIKSRLLFAGSSAAWILFLTLVSLSLAQEKENLRVVFTSLAWNSELPFRAALSRGFFKAQGLEIQPIFVRGGPSAMAALVSGEAPKAG
jgi:ABC-type nitrate/sulfonate/bicarbonate transport system substrate-binding protein